MLTQGLIMGFRAVTLVNFKTVSRILFRFGKGKTLCNNII